MAEMATSVSVGSTRCYYEGYYGIIRFIGLVPPTNGEWFGIEWDDSSRGKHDGTKDGIRYFNCKKSGNCGSFVRPKKISFGNTYKQSLDKIYGEAHEEVDIIFGDNSTGKRVEMYGFDKRAEILRQFSSLSRVDLRNSMVSSAGPNGEVMSVTPNVTVLDISRNPLLSSWEEIANIAGQLTYLKELCVSENRLTHLNSLTIDTTSFKGITILYINKMDIDQPELTHILSMMPSLQELHACENNISSLGMGIFPESLKILNLEDNNISNWNDILQFQYLPRLESLVLNDNKLSIIKGLTEGAFLCLKSLSLNGNNISQWSDIDNLNSLKALENFQFISNPIHKGEQSFFNRQLTIARLPLLKVVNNSPISVYERRDSERYYIKRYINEWLTAEEGGTTDDFKLLHPFYSHHVKVHGLPLEVMENRHLANQTSSAALRNRLIAITVLCPDSPNLPVLKKKIPDSITIQKLKGLLYRVYKINTSDQILSYKSHKMSKSVDTEIELNDDLKQLSFYSIESNDYILLRTNT